jgi:MacB-like periplasmic core domain/FtsX-like permease family
MPQTSPPARHPHPLRIAASGAMAALRLDRGAAILIGATAALVLAAVLPVTSLMGTAAGSARPRLEISTVAGGELGLPWADPRTPAGTQAHATIVLFGLLLGVAAATLATASITVVALVGARDAVRSPDDAVRRAVGASHATVRNAALLEAGAIAAIGALAGSLVGVAVGRVAAQDWPGGLGRSYAGASVAVVLAVVGVVIASALLPIIFARSGRLTEPVRAPRQIFVPASAQFAASVALLVTAALVARQATDTMGLGAVGGGSEVLELRTAARDRADLGRRYAALLDRLKAASLTASLTSPGAISGLGTSAMVQTDCGTCSEGGIPLRYHVFYATHHIVSPDSFQAIGIHVVAGRALQAGDRAEAARVAVVNRALAIRHFQQSGAVGRRMMVGDDKQWYTVVGVVDDAPAWGFGNRFQPRFTVYLSILQHPATDAELLVTGPGAAGAAGRVRKAVAEQLGPVDVGTTRVGELHAREAAPVTWFARWIAFEGWVTTVIACVGMFAVMRIWVRALIPELGVRRAMGATRRRLVALVAGQAAVVVVAGVVAGCWFGWSVWSVLPTILRGAATWDWPAIGGAALPLTIATLAGALLPAWRALRRDPADLIGSSG